MVAPPAQGRVRAARTDELDRLHMIEEASDALFAQVGMGPFAPDDEDHLDLAVAVFACDDPALGFASVGEVDGAAHLWQLSVLPSAGRQGRGTALVSAVCDWAGRAGYGAVTLTTFRDVPWNAPFYARLGFEVVDRLTPGLAAIRHHERVGGDDDFGPRVAMRKSVGP